MADRMSKTKHLAKSPPVGEQDASQLHVNQHWSNVVQEVLVSTSGEPTNAVTLCGGAEYGQFCWIGDIASDAVTYHHSGRLRTSDVLLEVQGQCVAGYTLGDVAARVSTAGRNSGPVLFKTVLSGV